MSKETNTLTGDELVTGRIYKVCHSRKGTFQMQVTDTTDETWISGVIVRGMARAIMDYNQRFSGDKITVRRSFIRYAVELERGE
jgi:hypothetical protein